MIGFDIDSDENDDQMCDLERMKEMIKDQRRSDVDNYLDVVRESVEYRKIASKKSKDGRSE